MLKLSIHWVMEMRVMLLGLAGGHHPGQGVRGAKGAAEPPGESTVQDDASVPQG